MSGNGSAPEPEISIRGLTKAFGRQTVLEDITWHNTFRFLGLAAPRLVGAGTETTTGVTQ